MRLEMVAFLAVVVVASGCTGSSVSEKQTGQFKLYVSDMPADISDFSHLNVTIGEARIFSENLSNDSEKGFRTFKVNETVDLTEVVGERREKVLSTGITPGTYNKVELHTGDIMGVVDNQSVNVKVPSEKLMITKKFEVAVNETTDFVFDINVVREGKGGYNLLPVISKSGVLEDPGENRKSGNGSGDPREKTQDQGR